MRYIGLAVFISGLALCSLFINGCTALPQGPTRTIEWKEWTDSAALRNFCDERIPHAGRAQFTAVGATFYACFREVGSVCVVHTMRADQARLGHEVRHCFHGLFHD